MISLIGWWVLRLLHLLDRTRSVGCGTHKYTCHFDCIRRDGWGGWRGGTLSQTRGRRRRLWLLVLNVEDYLSLSVLVYIWAHHYSERCPTSNQTTACLVLLLLYMKFLWLEWERRKWHWTEFVYIYLYIGQDRNVKKPEVHHRHHTLVCVCAPRLSAVWRFCSVSLAIETNRTARRYLSFTQNIYKDFLF